MARTWQYCSGEGGLILVLYAFRDLRFRTKSTTWEWPLESATADL